jgi:protein-disulfide isomerase
MRQQWLTIGAVVLGVVAIGAYLFWPRPHPLPVSTTRLDADPAIGPATAPVTIVEYGDFGCPTCKAWHDAGILKQTLAKYGDKIRFVWRDFPIITPQSPKAAEAGQCAFDQGVFWPYHDLLYARQPAIGVDDLKAYARELGLNTAKFDHCLDSGQYTEKVDRSLRQAENLGFQGTPGFQVNGRPLAGPPTFEGLSNLIDYILATK